MRRHSVIVRLNPGDTHPIVIHDPAAVQTTIHFVDGDRRLSYGLGQILDMLSDRSLYPPETVIDLAILATAVTAADTRISRHTESQDSWTREIDLYIPVQEPDLWLTI